MSLYLKYRPQTLNDMVGQRHIIDILLAQAQQGKFSSSYLLYGPRGIGKTSTARLLAKLVNSTSTDTDGNPDIVNDPSAKIINEGKSLDYVEIDAASHTGVDNIREEIIDKALYPPTSLKTKVYVIDEVHMLSKGAFNALLKIMEEPKPYLKFILATTEINKVPDTIISRCQVFNFKHMSTDELVGRLEYIATQEGFDFEKEALYLIARLSNGGMRDAIKYLEQVSILGLITQNTVAQFLGVVPAAQIEALMGMIKQGDYQSIISMLDNMVAGGTDLYALLKDLLAYCDQHFTQNPGLYAPLTGILQEMAAEMKRYPHPILVWKRKLFAFSQELGNQKPLTGDVPTQSSIPVQTSSEKSEGVLQKKTSDTVNSSETVSSVESTKKITEKPQITAQKTQSSQTSDDFSTIMETLIAKTEKVMIRSALKQHTMIEKIEDNQLSLLVINEQFYTILQKPETIAYLAKLLSEIRGQETSVVAKYMTKEDFMMQGM